MARSLQCHICGFKAKNNSAIAKHRAQTGHYMREVKRRAYEKKHGVNFGMVTKQYGNPGTGKSELITTVSGRVKQERPDVLIRFCPNCGIHLERLVYMGEQKGF